MVKTIAQELRFHWDTGKLEESIQVLKIQKLHGKKSLQLVSDVCHNVITLVEQQRLVYINPSDLERRVMSISTWKKWKNKNEFSFLNPDELWKDWALLRTHFATSSFETWEVRGFIFRNPSDNDILAIIYTHLRYPDIEYIIMERSIAERPIWADFLLKCLQKKYKSIWKRKYSE